MGTLQMAETTENKYAIHEAAREGRTQAVESLLSANPRLAKLADLDERLPIHWACAFNRLDVVKILASTRSFDPDVQDGSGWTPLAIASSLKDNSGEAIVVEGSRSKSSHKFGCHSATFRN